MKIKRVFSHQSRFARNAGEFGLWVNQEVKKKERKISGKEQTIVNKISFVDTCKNKKRVFLNKYFNERNTFSTIKERKNESVFSWKTSLKNECNKERSK